MPSQINPLMPVLGAATTASVRDNFGHAKTEIEALQTGKLDAFALTAIEAGINSKLNATAQTEIDSLKLARVLRIASQNETLESFQPCTTNNTAQVVQFNATLFNNHPEVFEFDSVNNEIVIKQAGWYSWALSFHIVRKIATGNVEWTMWTQTKEPSGSFTNYPASSRRLTLPPDNANHKLFNSLAFDVHTPVSNTRIRFMQACTDVTKDVGLISYPASGVYPSVPAVMLSVHKIGIEA